MLRNYLIIGWKVLLRRKFFTFVSLFGIVFTLLVLMIVVALIDNILYPAKAGSRLERAVIINRIHLTSERSQVYSSPSYTFLDRYARSLRTPELVSVQSRSAETVSYVRGQKLELQLIHADDVFWDVMEFDFIEGRPFGRGEVARADRVAVITAQTGRRIFGDGYGLGEWIETTDGSYRVIGVISHKQIPSRDCYADIYIPVSLDNLAQTGQSLYGNYRAYAVAPSGSDIGLIDEEIAAHVRQAAEDCKGEYDSLECEYGTLAQLYLADAMGVSPGSNQTPLAFAGIVLLMVLFMLFPAINLLNLNISRIIERASEIGIRRAFGASRKTLIGQFLTENLLLTSIGGAIAFLLSIAAVQIIDGSGLIPYGTIRLSATVFFSAVALTVAFGVFSGVLPAWRMSRLNPVDALKGGEL